MQRRGYWDGRGGEGRARQRQVRATGIKGAVVIFLDQVEKVNRVVEAGLIVGDLFVPVFPLVQPVTRVLVFNVPPFVTDEFLSRELSRPRKVVSPIKKISSGFKNHLLKHVVSHRRYVYMVLNDWTSMIT